MDDLNQQRYDLPLKVLHENFFFENFSMPQVALFAQTSNTVNHNSQDLS